MTKNKTPKITEAEWEVMRTLWTQAPQSSAEVVDSISVSRKWKPNTVKTLLQRLVKKGVVGTESGARGYLYSPLLTEAQCVRAESRSFVSRVCGGGMMPLIANFLQQERLSREEIQHLRNLLDDMEKKVK